MEALLIGAVATAIAWASWYFREARRSNRALRAAKAWPIGELPESATGRVITSPIRSRSGTFDDATPAEEAFLARHGHASKTWGLNRSIRYTEAVIEPGTIIAVLGSGVREPDPEARPAEGYRSAPPTRLRLTSSRQHPLVIGDDPSTVQR